MEKLCDSVAYFWGTLLLRSFHKFLDKPTYNSNLEHTHPTRSQATGPCLMPEQRHSFAWLGPTTLRGWLPGFRQYLSQWRPRRHLPATCEDLVLDSPCGRHKFGGGRRARQSLLALDSDFLVEAGNAPKPHSFIRRDRPWGLSLNTFSSLQAHAVLPSVFSCLCVGGAFLIVCVQCIRNFCIAK